MLVDASSQYGTFVDGRRVTELRITGPVTVQCGPEPSARIEVLPEPSSQDVPAASAPAPPPPPVAVSVRPPRAAVPAAPVPVDAAPAAVAPSTPPGRHPAPAAAVPPAHRRRGACARRPAAGTGGRDPALPPPAPVPAGPGAGFDETRVIAAVPGPGFQAPRSGPDLLVVAEGREYRYRHPAQVTVGRQPDCGIVISDPACSRIHGTIAAVPGGWVFANHSAEGTFDAGRRVDNQRFEGRTALRLGHPVAGPELMLVPILSAAEEERRFARKRRRKALLVVGGIAAVLLLVVGTVAAAVLLSDRGDDAPTAGTTSQPTGTESPDGERSGPVARRPQRGGARDGQGRHGAAPGRGARHRERRHRRVLGIGLDHHRGRPDPHQRPRRPAHRARTGGVLRRRRHRRPRLPPGGAHQQHGRQHRPARVPRPPGGGRRHAATPPSSRSTPTRRATRSTRPTSTCR